MALSVASRGAADSAMVHYISRKDVAPGAKRRDMAENPAPLTPQQAFEFMQKMWNPFGFAMPGITPPAPGMPGAAPPVPNPMTMFVTLEPAEIDKKIAELRVIENWLSIDRKSVV